MRFIFLYLTAIYAIFVSGCAIGQNKFITTETIEGIKKITVPIVCGAPATDGKFKITKTIGSAFFINDKGYFLTAGHVLDDWDKIDKSKGDCFPAVYIPKGGWQNLRNVQWLRFSCDRVNDVDVAVCKSIVNPFTIEDVKNKIKFAVFGTSSSLIDGTQVAFTGFPLDSWRPITSIGNIASYIKVDKLIVIDKNAWPGASGSPVYLADGKVIGVLIKRGINEGSGLAFAITPESVFEFLSKNNISKEQE